MLQNSEYNNLNPSYMKIHGIEYKFTPIHILYELLTNVAKLTRNLLQAGIMNALEG